MPKNIPVNIPPGDPGTENMRKQVSQALNRMGTQLANSDRRTANMDLQGNRVVGVADPGAPTDAVNLRTLKKHLDDITLQHVQRKQGNTSGGNYRIVWSNSGTLVAGPTIPPYIFFHAATPVSVKVAVLGTGTATAHFNVARIRVTNGTATTSTNILPTDLLLPPSNYGPVTSTAFVPNTAFAINDYVVGVCSIAGGVSVATIEMEVQP